jgi:hypothetical protein
MPNSLLARFWNANTAKCIVVSLLTTLLVLLLICQEFSVASTNLTQFWDSLTRFWEHGIWLGVSVFALLMLLAWFVMGADFKLRNKTELSIVVALAFLTVFPITWSLDVKPIDAKIVLKSLLPIIDATTNNQNSALSDTQAPILKSNKSDFNLLSVVTPIVALFLSLFPFLIAKTFREHIAELRAEIKTASSIKIVALNSKGYSYFNKLMVDRQHQRTGGFQPMVELFEVYFEDDKKLLMHLEAIEDKKKTTLFQCSESRQYLSALQNYYTDKNKETTDDTYKAIVSQCKRLLN